MAGEMTRMVRPWSRMRPSGAWMMRSIWLSHRIRSIDALGEDGASAGFPGLETGHPLLVVEVDEHSGGGGSGVAEHQVNQRVGSSLASRSFSVGWRHCRFQFLQQFGASVGVEESVEFDHALERLRDVQVAGVPLSLVIGGGWVGDGLVPVVAHGSQVGHPVQRRGLSSPAWPHTRESLRVERSWLGSARPSDPQTHHRPQTLPPWPASPPTPLPQSPAGGLGPAASELDESATQSWRSSRRPARAVSVAAGQQACCQSFESVDLRPEIQILAPDRLDSGWPLSRLLGCPCGFPLGCRLRRATQRIEHTFDIGTSSCPCQGLPKNGVATRPRPAALSDEP